MFLLNPDAIDYSISVSNPENFDGGGSNSSDDECGENDRTENMNCFKTRFEEGYDLPDLQ